MGFDIPKISVIIPIFNQELYLKECLNSIACQSFSEFEVLLVDDGSTDSSGAICELYVQDDSRFHLIKKNNGGVSSARNAGINNAVGEFITFVDADDWIKTDFLETLIRFSCNSDHVITGHNEFGYNNICNAVPNTDFLEFNSNSGTLLDIDADAKLWNSMYLYCWAQLFRRSIIVENNIRFNENLSLGEDSYFVLDYLSHAKHVSTVAGSYYMYRRYNVNFWEKYSMDVRQLKTHIEALTKSVSQYESSVRCSLSNLYSKNVNVYVNCYFQYLCSLTCLCSFRHSVKEFIDSEYDKLAHCLSNNLIVFFEGCRSYAFVYYCKIRLDKIKYKMKLLITHL